MIRLKVYYICLSINSYSYLYPLCQQPDDQTTAWATQLQVRNKGSVHYLQALGKHSVWGTAYIPITTSIGIFHRAPGVYCLLLWSQIVRTANIIITIVLKSHNYKLSASFSGINDAPDVYNLWKPFQLFATVMHLKHKYRPYTVALFSFQTNGLRRTPGDGRVQERCVRNLSFHVRSISYVLSCKNYEYELIILLLYSNV